jgi:hypothetical protein
MIPLQGSKKYLSEIEKYSREIESVEVTSKKHLRDSKVLKEEFIILKEEMKYFRKK